MFIFRFIGFIFKLIFASIIFIIDHILGIIVGMFMGLGKGASGMTGMGLRSFAIGLLSPKKK